jgi:hypothetical protein
MFVISLSQVRVYGMDWKYLKYIKNVRCPGARRRTDKTLDGRKMDYGRTDLN